MSNRNVLSPGIVDVFHTVIIRVAVSGVYRN
jgi:hypothetical protein